MELPPGVLGSKPPVDGGSGGISLLFESLDLPIKGNLVGDTLPQAGSCQDTELDLRHIEPTAVLGRMVELQPFYDPPGLRGGKASYREAGR